jgi:hypothetical protein
MVPLLSTCVRGTVDIHCVIEAPMAAAAAGMIVWREWSREYSGSDSSARQRMAAGVARATRGDVESGSEPKCSNPVRPEAVEVIVTSRRSRFEPVRGIQTSKVPKTKGCELSRTESL